MFFYAGMGGDVLLDARVRKDFGDFSIRLDISLEERGIVVLFGESGAGKTTLISMIAGFVKPDSGRISCAARVLFDSDLGIDLPPHRRGFGCVFQEPRLFPHMSVKSNLMFPARFCGQPFDRGHFERVVELLGIGHLMSRMPESLSGGESRRAAIGRALLVRAPTLLMDEPPASLDDVRRRELLTYIGSIPGDFGVTILYITHALDELAALADSVLEMAGGRVCGCGSRDDFLRSRGFRNADAINRRELACAAEYT